MNALSYSKEFIAAALRRSMKIERGREEMQFTAINGRMFEARKELDGRYFAFEYIPFGRIARERADGRIDYYDWQGHEAVKDDPNGYVAAAEADGVSREELIFGGAGYGVYTRYLSSLDEAAEEFAYCLSENVYYDDIDRDLKDDPEFNAQLRAGEEQMKRDYRADQIAAHEASQESEYGLFKGLYSMMGPLSDGAKERILSFFNSPSNETWDYCANLLVKGGGTTMWKLWCDTDPEAPRCLDEEGNWPRIPDAGMMRAALRKLGDASPFEDDEAPAPRRRF
jgi:hypothetical protein